MPARFAADAREAVKAAAEEARRRGDGRIGTDHLLLGLLQDPGQFTGRMLDVDLAAARSALDDLDRSALAAVGIDVEGVELVPVRRTRRHAPFTAGARAVLSRSLKLAAHGPVRARRISQEHLLRALLAGRRPDAAAELMARLGVDRAVVHARMDEAGAG